MIELTIKEPVPSLNKTLKEHWGNKTKRKKVYKKQLVLELLQHYPSKKRQKAIQRVHRTVTVHSQRMRKLDKDNLYGGGKSLIDVLSDLELIVDDTEQWLDLKYTQATGKPYFTRITIK